MARIMIDETTDEKKKKKSPAKKVAAAGLIFVLAVIIGTAVYLFVRPKTYSMTISLLYQQASSGLNPNGTRYSPYTVLSDEVLNPVEEKYGPVYDYLWIRPSQNGKGLSVATEYTLYCRGTDSCPAIMTDLSKVYTDYFEAHYTMNDSILKYEEPDKELEEMMMRDARLNAEAFVSILLHRNGFTDVEITFKGEDSDGME